MKRLALLFAFLPFMLSAQGESKTVQQKDPNSWPELITFDNVEIKKIHYKQSYNPEKPAFLEEKVKVETKMYPVEGPTGHGHYTTVYYLPKKDEFYIHSDCGMGHADGFLGPFPGNPKAILAKK